MRVLTLTLLLSIAALVPAAGQDPSQDVPPGVTVLATAYPPFTPGMRVQVGSTGVLPRNTPALTGTCGTDNHTCTVADAVIPNTFGVVEADAPVLDAGGTYYWSRVTFDSGVAGWVSAYPPYINPLSPPQMVSGASFNVVADYSGPALTQAICINDGANSPATLQLQAITTGVQGTLLCPQKAPGIGNHKSVIQAVNGAGTQASAEFQFVVNTAPIPQPPTAPSNLRIGPTGTGATRTQRLEDVKPGAATPPKK